jgi:hypothetical protein
MTTEGTILIGLIATLAIACVTIYGIAFGTRWFLRLIVRVWNYLRGR